MNRKVLSPPLTRLLPRTYGTESPLLSTCPQISYRTRCQLRDSRRADPPPSAPHCFPFRDQSVAAASRLLDLDLFCRCLLLSTSTRENVADRYPGMPPRGAGDLRGICNDKLARKVCECEILPCEDIKTTIQGHREANRSCAFW